MTSVSTLGTGWRLRGFLGDDWQLHRAQLHRREERDDDRRWVPARVPGSVLADLLAAGLVADPYVGTQSLLTEWVPQRTWVYRTRLRAPRLMRGERAFLEFDGIDHAGTVHLDGRRIAAHEGMFVPLVVEVTAALGSGTRDGGAPGSGEPGEEPGGGEPGGESGGEAGGREHSLAVVIEPAPVSEPQVGHTAAVRAHKSRMNYGWDFCPRLVHQGLWAPVRLRTTGPLRLADVWARPLLAGGAGRVVVRIEADGMDGAEGAEGVDGAGEPARGSAECVLRGPDGGIVATAGVPLGAAGPGADGEPGTVEVELDVPEPRRWRPCGLGEPHLYELTAVLRDAAGAVSDERRIRVGFRDVDFRRDPGAPYSALPYRLTVNGWPVPIKGWNWVPADALYGAADERKVRHLLGLARDAGVTMLRVWGGGLVETETFYDLCDEYGILVWQEFAQSSSGMSSVPSEDPAFVERMTCEAEHIVRARRNHPSLALWCGGNELQRPDGVPLADADSPVLTALRDVVLRLDPGRHWLPTSPSGPVFGNTLDSVRDAPEQHDVHGPWEHQGLDDHYRLYDSGRGLLLSEFGVEGMGNPRAIASVVPAPDRRAPTVGNPVWDHLGRWWNNEPMVRRAFGAPDGDPDGDPDGAAAGSRAGDPEDAAGGGLADLATLSRASQFLQADGLRYAVEAGRRRPESCGVLPWQLGESFPNGWCTAAVDYFGEPKAAYHYVRRAYRPLHVCAALPAARVAGDEFAATVWTWSDEGVAAAADGLSATAAEVAVTARVLRLDGSVVAEAGWRVRVEPGRPRPAGEIRCARTDLGGGPFLLDLAARTGRRTATNRYVLTAGADFRGLLDLPPARVAARLAADGSEWTLRLAHETGPAALFVRLLDARPVAEPGWMTWDDNAFDLLPGEERTLRGRWDGVPSGRRRVRLDSWNIPAQTLTEAG